MSRPVLNLKASIASRSLGFSIATIRQDPTALQWCVALRNLWGQVTKGLSESMRWLRTTYPANPARPTGYKCQNSASIRELRPVAIEGDMHRPMERLMRRSGVSTAYWGRVWDRGLDTPNAKRHERSAYSREHGAGRRVSRVSDTYHPRSRVSIPINVFAALASLQAPQPRITIFRQLWK
jgi:hypothetical protein